MRVNLIKIVICLLSFVLAPLSTVRAQLNTDRITAIGRNALYFDDYVLSIQYFNQVIKLKPYLPDPFLLRAVAKVQLGDYEGGLRDVNKAIELNPFNSGYYYTRGYIYRQLGDLQSAKLDFNQALTFSPENRTYLLLRSDVCARLEEYDQALADIDFLLHREPHSASLLFEKGIICITQKDTTCALECFSQTVLYDTQNPANWSALGMVQSMVENDDEALANLSNAIKLGSQWAGDYINRGIIYYRKHNFRSALSDYDKAIQLSPNDAQCYYNRGVMRQELGDKNNALADFEKALSIDPTRPEFMYQKAMILMELKQWKQAVPCFDNLIERYPYFLPSYYLAAQAKTALGEGKAAYKYRQTAYELEQKKDNIQSQINNQQSQIATGVTIAKSQPQKKDNRKEFSSRAAQNQEEKTVQIGSEMRGAIQNKYTDVINEPNIYLSYYHSTSSGGGLAGTIASTNYNPAFLDVFNHQRVLPAPLHVTKQDITLTAQMVNQHFERINRLTDQINSQLSTINYSPAGATSFNYKLSTLHFERSIEFALVQDYSSAIDDCTRALQFLTTGDLSDEVGQEIEVVMLFCRANWRYRLYEYQRSSGELTTLSPMDYEIMLRDYDYILRLMPNMTYAYYNKANILCSQKEFNEAIRHYTKAIEYDEDFAEAYFNRGLTYIFIGQDKEGLEDLSKAGELGIYQAYNLITRFK